VHARAAGEIADAASDKGQDGEYQDAPPNLVVQRKAIRESLEHEEQAPLDRPQRQPEEELDGEEFVQHDDQVILQAGVRLHLADGDGRDVEKGVDCGIVEGAGDGKGYQGEVHEGIFHLNGDPAQFVPSCASAHDDEDDGDA
jgi:hypothetical protein